MRHTKSLWAVSLVSLAVTGAYQHAAGSPGSTGTAIDLFKADFDSSTSNLVASVGKIYAFVTDQNAVSIEVGIAGNKLVIDDSYNSSGLPTAIACGLKDNTLITKGVFEFSYEVNVSASDLPFETGIIIDSPQSDMVPATGPDDEGVLVIGNDVTNTIVPANTDLQVSGKFSRGSEHDEWNYSITVAQRDPNSGAESFIVTGTGRVAGSADKPIVGLAFRKLGGATGSASIDEIHASVWNAESISKKP